MLKFEGKSLYGDDIRLTSDVDPKGSLNDVYYTREVEGGDLTVGYTNIEKVYRYGLISNRESWGHGPGYVWSSRVGCLNLVFETDFVEVVINNCAGYCMHSTDLIKLLPEGCYFERVECFEDKEPYYKLRGFYDLQWFADNRGVQQFNTTEKLEITDAGEINAGDFTLNPTNYDGVYVFDTTESLSSKYPSTFTHYLREPKRETNWSNAPKELQDAFVEVYVNYEYGYCASKTMLKEKFPERFKNSF